MLPEVSRQFVWNLTFSWSGKFDLTKKSQCISKIPLLSDDHDDWSISIQSSGSLGEGNMSPSCHSSVGALDAGDARKDSVAD